MRAGFYLGSLVTGSWLCVSWLPLYVLAGGNKGLRNTKILCKNSNDTAQKYLQIKILHSHYYQSTQYLYNII